MDQFIKGTYTVGITGASGAQYGIKLVNQLLLESYQVHLVITEAAWQVFDLELQLDVGNRERLIDDLFNKNRHLLCYHSLRDYSAPIASGSYKNDGMVIIPCSMGTLSSIAHASSNNLLERTADVMLKEKRKLIIVPRETPLNELHLENMLRLAKMGVTILPAMPGFYQQPKNLEDLINFVVGKVLDNLDVDHSLFTRWGEQQ
ncbi:UbiX family flavin prenyltransferase [Halalkalibacter hemicellulosilyticus]|uniref:Flavin prenyltransferase UbiX n=1 Tax=Halalkalibacter hemicellulosilyticusJCM 9152 TaxID=1236971 RepID=W4QAL9_9BACI|nr:flavin prenyltransferase UbiX [Halalkalibacter hemicellulosilyticus]GAE29012.1 3-polyprenyl-4-hydroxybenzoate carboxy-lyase UbiX [Halalkalibacter hemicellulosilyticusJCM 9152]